MDLNINGGGNCWIPTVIILLIVLFSITPLVEFDPFQSTHDNIDNSIVTESFISSQILHDAIVITSDTDIVEQAGNEGWLGNGSASNPFYISNYRIEDESCCISIESVSLHFVINGCLLISSSTGVYLRNSPNSVINNTELYGHSLRAIDVLQDKTTIMNCKIHNNSYGIFLHSSDETRIENATLFENRNGIFINTCDNITIQCCVIRDNEFGCYMITSENAVISNNAFVNDSIEIVGSRKEDFNHTLTNTTVNGKPLGVFIEQKSKAVNMNDYGYILLFNCSEIVLSSGVFIRTDSAIDIYQSEDIQIHDTYFEMCTNGVKCQEVSKLSIRNLTMNNISWRGIYLLWADDIELENISISGGRYPLYIVGTSRGTLTDIHITDAEEALCIEHSVDCLIQDASFRWNYMAVRITYSEYLIFMNSEFMGNNVGLYCLSSNSILIYNNKVIGNETYGYGITFSESSNNTIFSNLITNNHNWGIKLDHDSDYNLVYNNTIAWNIRSNAVDDLFSSAVNIEGMNWWDNGSLGNYWGDYSGVGYYVTDGHGDGIDHFPMKADTVLPTIDTPENIYCSLNELDQVIEWNANDAHPLNYTILCNGFVVQSGIWNESRITINLTGLIPGIYIFTIVIRDTCWNEASDSVLVVVSTTSLGPSLDVAICIGTAIGIYLGFAYYRQIKQKAVTD
ncbi:MAG: right-handed parallel beta-helix repeat-containing protein [Candidatus Thorarchaeota archaeon]